MELNKILIGVPVMVLIISAIMIFYSSGVSEYGVSDYNDTDLVQLQATLGEINTVVENTEKNSSEYGADDTDNPLDSLFVGGYRGAQTAGKSTTSFFEIINIGVRNLPIGNYSEVLMTALGAILLIVFVIGIIMHFATRSERN